MCVIYIRLKFNFNNHTSSTLVKATLTPFSLPINNDTAIKDIWKEYRLLLLASV